MVRLGQQRTVEKIIAIYLPDVESQKCIFRLSGGQPKPTSKFVRSISLFPISIDFYFFLHRNKGQ